MMRAFRKAQEYIDGIPKFVKKNTMEDTKAFYRRLSCPCQNKKVIHVAGTNGKGSVCAYLQSVLMEAGYSVGLFTSPHLVDIRERIRVDGEYISEKEFAEIFRQVQENCGAEDARRKPETENCSGEDERKPSGTENCGTQAEERQHAAGKNGDGLRTDYHPSYFEYLYFMAMLHFEKKQPDVIILETGLGGRFDATNSFETPCICIMTQIGLDHTEYLGETLSEIAGEKAGIVKKGIPFVYSANNKTVADVMEKTAKKAETRAFSIKPEEICLKKYDEKGIDFSYYSGYYKYSTFHLSTKALYQMENAALCVRAAAVLTEMGSVRISGEELRRGLAGMHWEGRMEEVLSEVYVDGAHNRDGMEAFLKSVRADGSEGHRMLLYSSLQEKACEEMIRLIADAGLFEEIVVTQIESYRAARAEDLSEFFGEVKKTVIKDAGRALQYCLQKKSEGIKIYITGSLYLAGQIKALIKQ